MSEQERTDQAIPASPDSAAPGEEPSEAEPAPHRSPRRSGRRATAQETTVAATNGATAGSSEEVTVPPQVVRAEQLLEAAILWAVAIGSVLARRGRWLVGRAREEMEDILAEAEVLHRQWQSARQAPQQHER
ncbi:hypothetical protein HRbin27_00735 [bacterium HR27]|nr:hypothetical protein HRbin27_00735 [bacterium HR27]